MAGPLAGLRVVELAGIGPAPFAAMVLADLGADVVRVDRPGVPNAVARMDVLNRGRRSVAVDLKRPEGAEVVLRAAGGADALIEGFRPGVAERLGVGPEPCLARNPGLVYGRMTGWGQEGPYAAEAGHDITYAAVAGALAHIGRAGQPPTPPLNLVADFGGGGMLLALGVVSAVLSAQRTGVGQVVDAAMVDGVALLMAPFFMALRSGYFTNERGTNMLDSGAPYYDSYACADGRWVAVGALEPQFFAALLAGLGIDPAEVGAQNDPANWPGSAGPVHGGVRQPYPGRVGRPLRRPGRLRRPGAHDGGDPGGSPPGRPGHRGRGRGCPAAGAGAPVRRHAGHPRPPPAGTGRAHRRGAGRAGLRPGGANRAARGGDRGLASAW